MTTFPGAPRLLKGGIVRVDPSTGSVVNVIALQYNPETLTRSLTVKAAGESGERTEALRLEPPSESIKLDAEIDAADQLELPQKNPNAVAYGILPQLAALETLVYPASADIRLQNSLAAAGTIEIAPAEAPLSVFVWGKNRILPMRLTEFSIVEEAFDPKLNPIRAKVSLTMRVLSVYDLPADHRGTALFMSYLQNKERLAKLGPAAALDAFGISSVL